MGFPGGSDGEVSACNEGWENPLEKGMTTHSGIAWEIPWTEEYCGLQATGLPRVGQD